MLSHPDNSGLLSYGISTSPAPLKASTQTGNATTAELVITVSNQTRASVRCRKIVFSLPIGENSDALTSNTEILCAANPADKWQIRGDGEGLFTASPISSEDNEILTEGISFLFYGIEVNKQVGTFTVSIEEESSVDNIAFVKQVNAYDLVKFPPRFYFGNFAASSPMVENGESVTLTWTGSDLASYTIKYGSEQVQVTNVRTWTSGPLTQNTTFELKATVLESGESVNHHQYVTVIVNNPDLVSNTISTKVAQVLGTIDIEGTAIVKNSLSVVEGDSVFGGQIAVSGAVITQSYFQGLGIVPIGSIVPFAGTLSYLEGLKGWLLCDGQSVSVGDYPALASILNNIYGGSDTSFNLPDYRGMFLRGVDGGSGNDPDADSRETQSGDDPGDDLVGTQQDDEFKKHNHSYDKSTYKGKGKGDWSGNYWENDGSNTGKTGGSETRPKNVYVYYLIRAL